MSWITIFKKEMKDSLSKKFIFALILLVLISWLISNVLVNMDMSSSKDKVNIGVIDLDRSNISCEVYKILREDAEIVYPAYWDYDIGDGSEIIELVEPNHSIEEAIDRTRNNGGKVLIVIEKGFSDQILNNSFGNIKIYWIVDSYGVNDMITSSDVMTLLDNLRQNMTKVLIPENSSINSSIITNSFEVNETTIFKGRTFENTSVGEAIGFIVLLLIILPVMVLVFIMFLGANIIESISKERRSDMLETLLSFPIKRRSIIVGKILSCIASMFVIILILQGGGSMAMMSLFSQVRDSSSSGQIRVNLSIFDYVLLMLIMFSGILCGIALLSCSAILTSTDTRSFFASLPTVCLFTIPTILLIIYDFSSLSFTSKMLLSVIPGSHPSIAINSVVNGNYLLAACSITYLVLFSLLVFALVIKLFKSDRVLGS